MKNLISVLLVMMAMPVSAHAFEGVRTFRDFANLQSHRDRASVKDESCVDFSGSWKGTCTGNGSLDIQIKQWGCQTIDLGGYGYAMGGSNTESNVGPGFASVGAYTDNMVTTVDWNADKSQLNFLFSFVARELNATTTAAQYTIQFKEVDSKLVFTYTIADKTMQCSLSKYN